MKVDREEKVEKKTIIEEFHQIKKPHQIYETAFEKKLLYKYLHQQYHLFKRAIFRLNLML